MVQFMMRMREVTVRRNCAASQVTFDLSLEGPAYKLSRKQVHAEKPTHLRLDADTKLRLVLCRPGSRL